MAQAIAQRPPPRTSGRLYLVLATGFAIIAGLLVFAALRDDGGSSTATNASAATLLRVVAVDDIPARTRVTAEMVAVQPIPVQAALVNAFASSESVIGQVTRFPIATNEQIGPQKVGATFEDGAAADTGLSFVIPAGHRAVAISVTESSAVAGLVVAGDHVDVLALLELDLAGIEKAVTVLQNVEVLSVAQVAQLAVPPPATVEEEAAAGAASDTDDLAATDTLGVRPLESLPQPSARTVTLAVLPEDAQLLALADQHATLYLTLRAFDDDETVTVSDSDLLPIGVLHPDLRDR